MPYCTYNAWINNGYGHNHYFIASCNEAATDLQKMAESLVADEALPTQFGKVGCATQEILDTIHERLAVGPLRLTATGQLEQQEGSVWALVDGSQFSSWYRNSFDE